MQRLVLGSLSLCSCSLLLYETLPETSFRDLAPSAVVAGQLDQDGQMDLLTVSFVSRLNGSAEMVLSVLLASNDLGASTQAFDAPFVSPVISSTNTHLADLDGDQDLDLVTSFSPSSLRLFFNDGGGGFSAGQVLPVPASPITLLEDLNGDDLPELIVGERGAPGSVVVFPNEGGSFGQSPIEIYQGLLASLLVGDFNSDASMDLVILNELPRLEVLLNDGAGSFSRSSVLVSGALGFFPATEGFDPTVAGDFNQDQALDLLAMIERDGRIQLLPLLNQGGGLSFSVASALPVGGPPHQGFTGDLDQDGDFDLVYSNAESRLESALSDGIASFTASPFLRGGADTQILFPGGLVDFDQDEALDLIAFSRKEGDGLPRVHVFFGSGDGLFDSSLDLSAGVFVE